MIRNEKIVWLFSGSDQQRDYQASVFLFFDDKGQYASLGVDFQFSDEDDFWHTAQLTGGDEPIDEEALRQLLADEQEEDPPFPLNLSEEARNELSVQILSAACCLVAAAGW